MGVFIVEAPIPHTIRHKHTVELVYTTDQLVAEAANRRKGRKSVSSTGFKPAILAIKRLQTYVLYHTETAICRGHL